MSNANRRARRHGVRDALGIPFLVLFASMVGFGSLARESGFTSWQAIATTLGIWGLPGQIVMAEMTAMGAPLIAIVIGVAIANARFFPMALALSPHLKGWQGKVLHRLMFAQFITLTPWAIALKLFPNMPLNERVPYYISFSWILLLGGVLGTALGYQLAGEVPRPLTLSLVFLSPAFFTMTFVDVRQRSGLIALVSGFIFCPLLYPYASSWSIPISGLLAGTFAFFLDNIMRCIAGKLSK